MGLIVLMGVLCSSYTYADGFNFRKPSPLYNKGEIFTRTVSGDVAIGVGADGTVLSADSSTSTGLKWVTPGATGVTNSGTLTSNAVIIGQGTTIIAAITADTSTSHFLGSTATSPAFRQIMTPDVAQGVFGANFGGTGQTIAAKGDLLVGNPAGTGWQKLTVGADGTHLSADAAQPLGVSWVTPPAGGAGTPGTPVNSIQFNSASSFGGAAFISTDTAGNRLAVGSGTGSVGLTGNPTMDVAGAFRMVPVSSADAASIQFDANRGNIHTVTLTGQPRALLKPVGGYYGQQLIFIFSQDATGARKIGFGAGFKFGTDVASYDASTTGGTRDWVKVGCGTLNCVSWDVLGISKGFR